MQSKYRKASLKANYEMHEGFRHADALTVSTPQLAEDYADYNDNIFVLRNYLDWEMWDDVEQQSEVERQDSNPGWLDGCIRFSGRGPTRTSWCGRTVA
jgi:hypothetical protein